MLLWDISRRFSRTLRADGFARFTSIVAVGSISLAFVALCISQSILAGYEEIIRGTAERFGMYLTVQHGSGYPLNDARPLQRSLQNIPGVQSARMMFRQETLIKHAASIDGAVITGVDWQMLSDVFTPIMIDGAAASRSGVLIGSGLRDRLGLSVSDTITLITQTASGDRPTIARRMITGVFRSGIASYDDHVVLTEISDARSILRAGPHQSTAIIVQCDSDDMIPVLRNHVSGSFGNDLTLLTYRDHLASIWNWIELQRRPIPLILSLIAIVSAFTVTSALILTIVSKTRSMAILSTLGLSWWRISGIIGLRAVTITVIGLFWGLTASMMFIIVQRTWKPLSLDGGIYYVSHLPVALDPGILATSALLIFGVSALASIAPMIIAARLKPASALRFR